jgi:hypothetical protein
MSALGHNPTSHLPFPSSQRLRDFAGFVEEKLCDGTECAVLQGDNSDGHAGVWQLDGQDLDSWTLGQSKYEARPNRQKAPSRHEIEPHAGGRGEDRDARLVETAGAEDVQARCSALLRSALLCRPAVLVVNPSVPAKSVPENEVQS